MKRKNKILIMLLAVIFIWNANFSYAEEDDEFEQEHEYGQQPSADTLKIPDLPANTFDNPAVPYAYFDSYQPQSPWAWYLSRATALVGFFLLYLSIFFGLSIRLPVLWKIIQPVYSVKIHGWISLQALFFAFIHIITLALDKFISLDLINIFIPFMKLPDSAIQVGIRPAFLNLGIIGFYLMLILVFTSYIRKFLSHRLWRLIHFANIVLYVFVILHALVLGTDMEIPLIRNIFIAANIVLAVLFIINIIYRIFYEDIRQSNPEIIQAGNNQNFRRRV